MAQEKSDRKRKSPPIVIKKYKMRRGKSIFENEKLPFTNKIIKKDFEYGGEPFLHNRQLLTTRPYS